PVSESVEGRPCLYLRLFILLALVVLVVVGPAATNGITPANAATAGAAAQTLPLFATESAAQAHCPRDVVVWLNLPTGIYHLKGERWYGRTKRGVFVCKRVADAAGDRQTLNGQ